MALDDPDIDMFTSEEEVESSPELFGPTPIPSSSQQQPEIIMPSREQQQDADASSVSSTQQQSIDGSQDELRSSQALSPEDEVWMQKMDEILRQCRADLADLKDSGVGLSGEEQQHQVDGGMGGASQDEVESHKKVSAEMRKFQELEQLFKQIHEKKQQVEKEVKEGRPGAEELFEMLVDVKQRIRRHLEAQKKKVATICSDPRS